MSIFTSTEIGSPANQASQRAIRNGWLASFIHVSLAFSYGGFYHPTWLTGNMIEGIVFSILTLTVPITMTVVGITSYKLHYKKLMHEKDDTSSDASKLLNWMPAE